MKETIEYSDIENIINDTNKQLCNKEDGFEEFERGANVACKNILLTVKQIAKNGLKYESDDAVEVNSEVEENNE